ncbi:hypothetical protein PCASD_06996 [Puccinia coronata f. sp. avenae]|uniref:Uncharacterized protein n=1 Tax=Puccinia coronata f. sp. avenae TaxID=200324 RepID=A0A2N5UZQ8_9BASI|nr:hypothetical protein PCASD_06996 [Puccinia coronata f. sp. avenae]
MGQQEPESGLQLHNPTHTRAQQQRLCCTWSLGGIPTGNHNQLNYILLVTEKVIVHKRLTNDFTGIVLLNTSIQ